MLTEEQKKFKDAWISELRSGEWTQIKGQLGNATTGRCCLGVASDVAMKQGLVEGMTCSIHMNGSNSQISSLVYSWPSNGGEPIEQSVMLPFPVDDRLDIHPDGWYEVMYGTARDDIVEMSFTTFLAECNDCGMSFNQIADLIEWSWV